MILLVNLNPNPKPATGKSAADYLIPRDSLCYWYI